MSPVSMAGKQNMVEKFAGNVQCCMFFPCSQLKIADYRDWCFTHMDKKKEEKKKKVNLLAILPGTL